MKDVIVALCLLLSVSGNEMQQVELILFPNGDGVLQVVDLTLPVPDLRVEEDEIEFRLYSRPNTTSYERIRVGDLGRLRDFQRDLPVRVVVHGWQSSSDHMLHVTQAYLAEGDYNVVNVDWSGPAGGLYTTAKGAVTEVGAHLAALIDYLSVEGLDRGGIHLVGHSLGAHVVGVAGSMTMRTIERITGCDPAAPLFGSDDPEIRLDSSDAEFVQVIHTSLLGWQSPLGHVDFFPNGGWGQPGCGLDLANACSHSRSHEFFAESIGHGQGFYARECDSWDDYKDGECVDWQAGLMGENALSSVKGSFYLRTNGNPPYARG